MQDYYTHPLSTMTYYPSIFNTSKLDMLIRKINIVWTRINFKKDNCVAWCTKWTFTQLFFFNVRYYLPLVKKIWFDDGYQSGRLLDGCFGERVVNCGCRSDELESQTEPVVRRGRRIVTTSKITDWVGDGNSFWTMRRVRDCRRICWLEATEEETKRQAWRWEEIDWCCKDLSFFIYIF